MTLRLSDEEQATLQVQAEREGASMQEVARRAIRERAERWDHSARVTDSAERMIERWADVLDSALHRP